MTSFLKSKPRTFGDLLCEVKSDAVTSVTKDRRIVKTESARRTLGEEEGMTVLRGCRDSRKCLNLGGWKVKEWW